MVEGRHCWNLGILCTRGAKLCSSSRGSDFPSEAQTWPGILDWQKAFGTFVFFSLFRLLGEVVHLSFLTINNQPPKTKLTSILMSTKALRETAPSMLPPPRRMVAKNLRRQQPSDSNQHWRADCQKSSEIEVSFVARWLLAKMPMALR